MFSAGAAEKEEGFTPLFNGQDLSAWHALPGGTWEAVEGVIVGKSPASEKRHGLLVSDGAYRDFIVRLRFKVIEGNSGFYFRSAEKPETPVGIHGFQAEIEPGYETGGLYETGGRKWVVRQTEATMKDHYKPGKWNRMSISARRGRIVVRVNGFTSAELTADPGRPEGRFAMQLHGGQDMHVSFKDLRIKTLGK